MKTETEKRIEQNEAYIDSCAKTLAACCELLQALKEHKGKLIDVRFFKEHFTIKDRDHEYLKYEFYGRQYDWQSYNYRLYLTRDSSVELQTREKEEVVAAIKKLHENSYRNMHELMEENKALESLDEEAIVADLVAVYEKYGRPKVWQKVLESFNVKYPNE